MGIPNVPSLNPLDMIMIPSSRQVEMLSDLFRIHFGSLPHVHLSLKGDASSRCLHRLINGENSAIGVYGPNRTENAAFLGFTKTFLRLGLPVPQLLIANEDGFTYLLEDLGNETLFQLVSSHRQTPYLEFPDLEVIGYYQKAVASLVEFQMKAAKAIDLSLCYQGRVFDEPVWKTDYAYFLDKFVEMLLPNFSERKAIEQECLTHCSLLQEFPCDRFLYRDFQSRNIMVTAKGLKFLDYQSGRLGAVSYDIASLMYDARADLPDSFRSQLFELHVDLLLREGYDEKVLRDAFAPYALIRILQALGSYGNNGICNGRREHLASIPFGIRNAQSVIENDQRLKNSMTAISRVLNQIAEEQRWEKM